MIHSRMASFHLRILLISDRFTTISAMTFVVTPLSSLTVFTTLGLSRRALIVAGLTSLPLYLRKLHGRHPCKRKEALEVRRRLLICFHRPTAPPHTRLLSVRELAARLHRKLFRLSFIHFGMNEPTPRLIINLGAPSYKR